jgi:uncharacterized membrane protein YkoI
MHRIAVVVLAVGLSFATPGSAHAQGTKAKAKSPPALTQAQLQEKAKIKESDAEATAIKEVPGGTVSKHMLAEKKGKVVYQFTISVAGKPGSDRVDVDAATGTMLSHTHKAPTTAATKKPGG